MNDKILVFGGAGFVGSHVADEFTKRGAKVTIFDCKDFLPYLSSSQKLIVGNIANEQDVSEAINDQDYVLNFAGMADIDECVKDPVKAVKYNILGNTIIMDSCVKHNIKRYIFASSVYVYNKLGGIYKNTKQSCELLIDTYHKLKGLNYTIIRYGSLYGPRSDNRNRIYKIVESALKNGFIEYDGTGNEIREFIHVKDAAHMTAEVLYDDGYKNENIILTGEQSLRYKELLSMVNEMLDGKINIKYQNNESETHYITTPYYHFRPKEGKKLTLTYYRNLGQGLLELMESINKI